MCQRSVKIVGTYKKRERGKRTQTRNSSFIQMCLCVCICVQPSLGCNVFSRTRRWLRRHGASVQRTCHQLNFRQYSDGVRKRAHKGFGFLLCTVRRGFPAAALYSSHTHSLSIVRALYIVYSPVHPLYITHPCPDV